MKHHIFLCFLTFCYSGWSQSRFVIDFDTSLTTFNSWGNTYFSNANDPDDSSNAVGKIYNGLNSAQGGVYYDPLHQISMDQEQTIHLDFFNGSTGMTIVKFKLEGQVDYEVVKFISGYGWHDVTFSYSYALNLDTQNYEMASGKFQRMTLIVNPGQNIEGEYYFDNIDFPTIVPQQTYSFDELVWSDECDGSGAIDTNKWFHQTLLPNGSSWFNGEIQHYTDREENAFLSNGFMYIRAKKENYTNQNVTKAYTSARLNSKYAFTYGKVEIRAQIPTGIGTWPALWLLGQNITENGGFWASNYGTTPWPNCGEIDIMEHWGHNQDFIQSALHNPSSYGGTIYHGGLYINEASTSFHTYVMEWTPEDIRFYVDGINYYNYDPVDKNVENWPYDNPMYLLLNTAIEPSVNQTNFTQSDLIIDYIRVYDAELLSNETEIKPSVTWYYNKQLDGFASNHNYKNTSYTLYNLSGQIIDEGSLGEDKQTINSELLNVGIYLLELNKTGKSEMLKVIKF
jgi:beta-glucanase (GH16 family)